ncbi:MAG TPA: MarR family transcriptional regulator [Chloroflexota bacterium]
MPARAAEVPTFTSTSTSTQIVDLASDLVARIFAHLLARAAEFNLSLPEAKALLNLEPEHALPMREVAARLHANPSNVTVTIGRLESRGLLSRELGADRRVKGVRLTPLGAEQRARLEARLLTDHPAVRGLSDAEQHQLLALLQRLTSAPGRP